MILLGFWKVLFLRSGPVFPCPFPLAPFCPFCGTGWAIKCVVFRRGKYTLTFPTPPPTSRRGREQVGAQAGVLRQNSGAEPAAQERVGNTLNTDALQHKAAPLGIVTAPMHQLTGGAILLIGHVRDGGGLHFASSLFGSLT